jgi:crotonobetainyl-CoA:carnitine CoA-transferase CaiB-like acyl-CoA transferase
MTKVMEGVRVLEVAMWGFVPSAGAVLADWGAEVLKVEHPVYGDPMRGLTTAGLQTRDGVTFMWEIANRGKRDIGIDVSTPQGHEVLMKLVERSDVFLTNFLPSARAKLGIDVADVMTRNPGIIYARGSGQGPQGEEADKGGFDAISYWFRTGAGAAVTPGEGDWPLRMPGPAYGDVQAGMMLAGGVGAALAYKARTGKGTVVDGSLLAAGMWAMQPAIVGTQLSGLPDLPHRTRSDPNNPLATIYRTADGRYVALSILQADRYWPDFCRAIGHPELRDDPRFASHQARVANGEQTIKTLDAIFGSEPLAVWQQRLATQEGQWDVVKLPSELSADNQARANGYLSRVSYPAGVELDLVTAPVQFDEEAPQLSQAPELGANTEEVLLELGYEWDEIITMKDSHAVS